MIEHLRSAGKFLYRWLLRIAVGGMVTGLLSWLVIALRIDVLPFVELEVFRNVSGVLLPTSALLGIVFFWMYRRNQEKIQEQNALTNRLREAQKSLSRRNRELQTSVEFLSAAREISLVLNEKVEEEVILKRVLKTTAQLLEEDSIEEIAIMTPEGDDDGFRLRAVWEEGDIEIGSGSSNPVKNHRFVSKTFEHGQVISLVEKEKFYIFIPLSADREKKGVLKIVFHSVEQKDQLTSRYEALKPNLLEYSKLVALAIKTPDLYTRTIKDSLTGLYSKRHLLNQLETHVSLSRRHGEPLSIVFLDIDHFKQLNDTYGHQAGDRVLKRIGSYITEEIREYTTAYRYGGEEIVILAPRTDREGGRRLANRLREGIEALEIVTEDGTELTVTASFGVSSMDGTSYMDPDELLERADSSLYRAKEEGRNQVRVYDEEAAVVNG